MSQSLLHDFKSVTSAINRHRIVLVQGKQDQGRVAISSQYLLSLFQTDGIKKLHLVLSDRQAAECQNEEHEDASVNGFFCALFSVLGLDKFEKYHQNEQMTSMPLSCFMGQQQFAEPAAYIFDCADTYGIATLQNIDSICGPHDKIIMAGDDMTCVAQESGLNAGLVILKEDFDLNMIISGSERRFVV